MIIITTIFVGVLIAVLMLAIGFGQGLAFNVKGVSFEQGLKLSIGELALVALAIILIARSPGLVAFADAFLAAGILVGVLMTQNERPIRFISETRHADLHIGQPYDECAAYGQQVDILA